MILYFSATGNSEHVARRVAAATGDKSCRLSALMPSPFVLPWREGPVSLDLLPRCMPGLPTPMIEFLKTADLSIAAGAKDGGRPYTFYVSTYGSTTGQSAKFARDLLRERGLELDAAMSVKMPDTWTLFSTCQILKRSRASTRLPRRRLMPWSKRYGRGVRAT